MDRMVVVDASVLVSWFIRADVHFQSSDAWLSRYLAGGGQPAVPTLLLSELAGSIARRRQLTSAGLNAVWVLTHLAAVQIFPIDRTLGDLSARIAADTQMRGADAVYVALARAHGVPLITWDVEQHQRAATLVAVSTPASYIF